jgi:hypothetical protein
MDYMAQASAIIGAFGGAVDSVIDTCYKPRLIDSAIKTFGAGQESVVMSACMNMVFTTAMGFANYTLLKSSYYNPLCNLLSWSIATGYMYRQYTKGAFTLQGSEKVFVYGCLSKMPIYVSSCLIPHTIHSIFHMRSLLYA